MEYLFGIISIIFLPNGFLFTDTATGCYNKTDWRADNVMYVEDNCNGDYWIINGKVVEDNLKAISINIYEL